MFTSYRAEVGHDFATSLSDFVNDLHHPPPDPLNVLLVKTEGTFEGDIRTGSEEAHKDTAVTVVELQRDRRRSVRPAAPRITVER
jgi:hypothetical protein